VDQNLAKLTLLETVTKQRKLLELEAKSKDAKRELERTEKSQRAATEKAKGDKSAAEKTLVIEKKTLERIEDQIARCVIRAPQDGIVIYFRRGWWDDESRIRPGVTLYSQQIIFTLPDLTQMRVKLKVHESVVKRVALDLPCRMQIDALPGINLTGKVTNVGSVAQSDGFRGGGVKEYSVESSIDNLPTDAGLKPGMTAEVKVVLKTLRDVLVSPIQTVTELDGKNVVYVVTPGGVERREVELGDRNDTNVQILSGVLEGETLALDARLRAAAEVKARDNTKDNKTP
jgi:RND family efflux transporter MFP subunit